jgi:hypothetical protein
VSSWDNGLGETDLKEMAIIIKPIIHFLLCGVVITFVLKEKKL